MNFVLDLIIIGIIAFSALISAKRGFVKVVVEAVGFVVACIIAFSINTPLAESTYDKFIEPPIINTINSSFENATNDLQEEAWETMPDFITDNAELLGIEVDGFNDKISENISSGVDEAITAASQDVIKPVFTKILATVYGVILVFVLLFIVKILAKIINKLFSFSIVGKANKILGGVVGIPKGIVFAIIFAVIISILVSITGGFAIFTPENIDKTILFKLLAGII